MNQSDEYLVNADDVKNELNYLENQYLDLLNRIEEIEKLNIHLYLSKLKLIEKKDLNLLTLNLKDLYDKYNFSIQFYKQCNLKVIIDSDNFNKLSDLYYKFNSLKIEVQTTINNLESSLNIPVTNFNTKSADDVSSIKPITPVQTTNLVADVNPDEKVNAGADDVNFEKYNYKKFIKYDNDLKKYKVSLNYLSIGNIVKLLIEEKSIKSESIKDTSKQLEKYIIIKSFKSLYNQMQRVLTYGDVSNQLEKKPYKDNLQLLEKFKELIKFIINLESDE